MGVRIWNLYGYIHLRHLHRTSIRTYRRMTRWLERVIKVVYLSSNEKDIALFPARNWNRLQDWHVWVFGNWADFSGTCCVLLNHWTKPYFSIILGYPLIFEYQFNSYESFLENGVILPARFAGDNRQNEYSLLWYVFTPPHWEFAYVCGICAGIKFRPFWILRIWAYIY